MKTKTKSVAIAAIVCALAVSSSAHAEQKKAAAPASAAPAAAAPATDKVLATVGTEKITLVQFQDLINGAPANVRPAILQQKDRFLQDLVNESLIYQEGEALKLAQDPVVQQALDRAKKQFIIQRLLQVKIQDKVKVTPEEAKAYFEKNKAQFKVPERVRAAHILVADEKLAKQLLEKIKKGGDFGALAAENSIDPSKANGGDLGFFERGRMVPEFETAAFALKENEVSGVVKSQFGYHIIKSLKQSPARELTFDEIKEKLEQQLLAQKQETEIQKLLEELKKKTPVKTNTELLSEVK